MPIRLRLLAATSIPLIGASLFAVQLGQANWQRATDAHHIREQTEDLAVLVEITNAVSEQLSAVASDEPIDRTSVAAIAAFDGLAGADASDPMWERPREVHQILGFRDAVMSATPEEAAALHDTLEPLLHSTAGDQATHLAAWATSRDLVPLAQAVEASLRLQQAADQEVHALEHLLGSDDEPIDLASSIDVAIAAAAVDRAQADFRDEAPPSVRARYQTYLSTDDAVDLGLARTTLLSAIESGGLPTTWSPQEILRLVEVREKEYRDLDQSLNRLVNAEAQRAESEARTALVLTLLVLVCLFGTSTVLALLIIRSITDPLGRLEAQAILIGRGELPIFEDVPSPRDLATVQHALSELTQGLDVVRRQSIALSDGELDHPVLDYAAPGELGRSLQKSVLEIRNLTSKLDHQATHDAMTGLPNRAAILGLLEASSTGPEARRRGVTAIMMDLDGFKQTNDSLGHPVGDELLRMTAERLRACADGSFVGRLGGDEFIVLLEEEAGGHGRAEQMARTIIEALNRSFPTSVGNVWLSASAGIVESSAGSRWLSPSEILQRVDVALLEAKSSGAGSVVHFDETFNDSLIERSRLQSRLRLALERDELSLHFQPIVESASGRVSGVESLLRWFERDGKAIPPDVFIPAAEQSDLILLIDDWVLRTACQTLARWQLDPVLAGLSISVNISGRHMASTDLVTTVGTALRTSGARPELLTIEITETELIPNLDAASVVIEDLKTLGVRLAIDDFGTGYSSVAHLRRVDVHRIKIDGSFVSSLDETADRAIADLLVSLGQSLALEIVAESVETAEQLAWTWDAGCTHVQGHFFAPACAPSELKAVILRLDSENEPREVRRRKSDAPVPTREKELSR